MSTKKRIAREIIKGKKTWWEQEGIDEKDMQNLPDTHIDWVISHVSPITMWSFFDSKARHLNEPSQIHLEKIQKRYQPSKWFHGHYHIYREYEHDGCKFTSLDCVQNISSWHKKVADIMNESHS